MDASTKEVIDVLSWWTAERFKSLQRKLTTASNTIRNDALSSQFKPFLDHEEIETLQNAAKILSRVKDKVEHAKEIKARNERSRELRLKACWSHREELFNKYIPQNGRDLLLLRLALGLFHNEYYSSYFPENYYISNTLERVLDPKHHFGIGALYSDCRSDIEKWLVDGSALWTHDQTPEPKPLEDLMARFKSEWREHVSQFCCSIVDKYDEHYRIDAAENVVRLNNHTIK